MGLLYQFPISIDEENYVVQENDQLTLKSYGLPIIFWFYFLGSMIIFSFLTLGVMKPLRKLLTYPDPINQLIGYSLIFLLISIPLTLIAFFFYEKRLTRFKDHFGIGHHLFGFKFKQQNFSLKDIKVSLDHFLDSPNMARMQNVPGTKGFQNKGYFELYLVTKENRKVLIDRSSRKIDLEKIKDLLSL